MIHASGILFLTPDERTLLLRRSGDSDHAGEWCLPGGTLEGDETAEQAAVRECEEEIGACPDGERAVLMHAIAEAPPPLASVDPVAGEVVLPSTDPATQVAFTTFIQRVAAPFVPDLSEEHDGWAWTRIGGPPQPLHPGTATALRRLSMTETEAAQAMIAGEISSPHRFENMTLFNLRITGTGVSYRSGIDEFVWRNPQHYMTDEFVQRCAGLPVIMDHPEGATLNSEEYADRNIGSVMMAYLVPEAGEVWAIARVYDDEAIKAMSDPENPMSTSPTVVFRGKGTNTTLTTDEGDTVLVEGNPRLLDHVAVCAMGVWDKGVAPQGIEVAAQADSEPSADQYGRKLADAVRAATLLDIRMSNHASRIRRRA